MKCIVRKLILRKLNQFLDAKRNDVAKAKAQADLWLGRAKMVVQRLEGLSKALEDGKIDDAEINRAVEDIQSMVEAWR